MIFSDVQVALGRHRRADQEGLVGLAHVGRVAVDLRVDGDRADAHLLQGPRDADRDLAAVGYQHLLEHHGARSLFRPAQLPAGRASAELLLEDERDRALGAVVAAVGREGDGDPDLQPCPSSFSFFSALPLASIGSFTAPPGAARAPRLLLHLLARDRRPGRDRRPSTVSVAVPFFVFSFRLPIRERRRRARSRSSPLAETGVPAASTAVAVTG